MKKENDLEAKLFMKVFNLREEVYKQYSSDECAHNIVYIFENEVEFRNYFMDNGYAEVYEELLFNEVLNLLIMKKTKKGSIIALKGLCDHAITKKKELENFVNEYDKTNEDKNGTMSIYVPQHHYTRKEKERIKKEELENFVNEYDKTNEYKNETMSIYVPQHHYTRKEKERIKKEEAKILKLESKK